MQLAELHLLSIALLKKRYFISSIDDPILCIWQVAPRGSFSSCSGLFALYSGSFSPYGVVNPGKKRYKIAKSPPRFLN